MYSVQCTPYDVLSCSLPQQKASARLHIDFDWNERKWIFIYINWSWSSKNDWFVMINNGVAWRNFFRFSFCFFGFWKINGSDLLRLRKSVNVGRLKAHTYTPVKCIMRNLKNATARNSHVIGRFSSTEQQSTQKWRLYMCSSKYTLEKKSNSFWWIKHLPQIKI